MSAKPYNDHPTRQCSRRLTAAADFDVRSNKKIPSNKNDDNSPCNKTIESAEGFIMKFMHYLIIAIIAGFITICGRIIQVRWTEYYRLRALLKTEFEEIITKFKDKTPQHPASYVENNHIDIFVRDILNVMPPWKSKQFRACWNEYRYDKEIPNMTPREYTQKSPDYARRLISDRLHNLISKL